MRNSMQSSLREQIENGFVTRMSVVSLSLDKVLRELENEK